MRRLIRLCRWLTYVLPAVLFFSYYPVITLGKNETMNFELSLPLIWLVVFDVVMGVTAIMKYRGGILKEIWMKKIWLMLPIFATVSIMWSQNPVRGALTCGILWLIYIAGFLVFELRDELTREKNYRMIFLRWFFAAGVMAVIWCVLQCVLDVAGLPREATLLCPGCVSETFGFPHPNGFAIEPQFMGNLLLAPAILSGWMVLKKKPRFMGLFFVFVAGIFLTFSRGAIYAFAIAMVLMVIMWVIKTKKENGKVAAGIGKVVGVMVVGFLVVLISQGIMTELGPTNDTFADGAAKVVDQLTLGVIDVRGKAENSEAPQPDAVIDEEMSDERDAEKPDAMFDGYVEESTNTRVKLTNVALEVWSKKLDTMLIGVGIGGAGEALYKNGLTESPKEIVQNQYASLILELGVIGVFAAIVTVIMMLKGVLKSKAREYILPLIVAFSVTLFFFAGLPNALQIYLLPVMLFVTV